MIGSYFFLQQSIRADDMLEDMFTHVRIHRAQWIVQEISVCIRVDGSCQA